MGPITYTFALLVVAQATYDDVRRRLIDFQPHEYLRDLKREYLDTLDGQEIIVLGKVALVAERSP